MSTHNMFLCRNKKNIIWIPHLIWSYAVVYGASVYTSASGICHLTSAKDARDDLIYLIASLLEVY